MKWLSKLFSKPTPAPVREIKYCKHDGKELTVTKKVVEYDQYTGLPSVFTIQRECPVCHTQF